MNRKKAIFAGTSHTEGLGLELIANRIIQRINK